MPDRRYFLRSSLLNSLKLLALNSSLLPLLSIQARAELFGQIPADMPLDQSIYRLRGDVWVNGVPATLKTIIDANATVRTGADSEVIFVIGKDAHILRENSEVTFSGTGVIERGLKLLTGKLLSVFGERDADEDVSLETSTATIGIRGTGVYCESYSEFSYICNCYGSVMIQTLDGAESERSESRHHDMPRFVYASSVNGQRIAAAPMVNHTDQELALIEALVGRVPPYANFLESYQIPRRQY